jgi:hypothetical protein
VEDSSALTPSRSRLVRARFSLKKWTVITAFQPLDDSPRFTNLVRVCALLPPRDQKCLHELWHMQIGYEHQFAFSQQRSGVIVWINLDIMNVYTAGMIRNPHVLLPHFLTNEFLRDSFLQLGLRVLNNWNWLASPVKDYAIKTESIGVFYDDLLQRASSWCFHLRNCQFCHMERDLVNLC